MLLSHISQVRSLSVLEGIALASDPNYKVLGATYPWIARRLLTDRSPELKVRRLWHQLQGTAMGLQKRAIMQYCAASA